MSDADSNGFSHVEFKVIAMKRSGMHCIIDWIASQFYDALFINNVHGGDLYRTKRWNGLPFCYYLNKSMNDEFYVHGRNMILLSSADWLRDQEKDCLLYNYEDFFVKDAIAIDEKEKNKTKLVVLVLRSPLNLFASRRQTRQSLNFDMWMEHASYFLDGDQFICIKFDKWFSDASYRKSVLEDIQVKTSLKLAFRDSSVSFVARYGRGSSFDRYTYKHCAQKMDVLGRFKQLSVELPNSVKEKSLEIFGA